MESDDHSENIVESKKGDKMYAQSSKYSEHLTK